MTSYTKKLYTKDPAKAVAIHRLRYGRHTMLASFSLAERDRQDAAVALGGGRRLAQIEDEFDVTERLQRWSDRGWR